MQKERVNVIKFLEEFKPQDHQEKTDIEKIIELILQYEDIFVRECLPAHITASALVVNPETMMVLLHNHRKLNKWLQFGGHADGDTDLIRVALKEASEETGLHDLKFYLSSVNEQPSPIDIELQTIPEKNGVPEHYHLDFRFLLFTSEKDIPTPDESESQELGFFSFLDIEKMGDKLDPALMRLITKAKLICAHLHRRIG